MSIIYLRCHNSALFATRRIHPLLILAVLTCSAPKLDYFILMVHTVLSMCSKDVAVLKHLCLLSTRLISVVQILVQNPSLSSGLINNVRCLELLHVF